jgi:hypothetical protein
MTRLSGLVGDATDLALAGAGVARGGAGSAMGGAGGEALAFSDEDAPVERRRRLRRAGPAALSVLAIEAGGAAIAGVSITGAAPSEGAFCPFPPFGLRRRRRRDAAAAGGGLAAS